MPKEERERELKKKKWTTPQLIILVRGKPEEGVLLACKGVFLVAPESGPNQWYTKCWAGETDPGCYVCDLNVPS